jgi:hypothetical protein
VVELHADVVCAQCGVHAPAPSVELDGWRHADFAASALDVDEVAAAMVLCPDCDADVRNDEYDPGAGG